MSRFSVPVMVIQQSQEKMKKLIATADEIMQSGISLAEDLVDSGEKYVSEIEKCLMELAEMTQNVDAMQRAIQEVDNELKERKNEEKPPDLADTFSMKLQGLNKCQCDPKTHPRIVQFMQQIRECGDESEEEMETQDGEDDELVLGHVQKSLNCPLTKKYFEDAVTSKICKHSYSKAAILEHIRKRPMCPVCNTHMKESDLKKDEKLQRKVWKAKKQDKRKKANKEGVVRL